MGVRKMGEIGMIRSGLQIVLTLLLSLNVWQQVYKGSLRGTVTAPHAGAVMGLTLEIVADAQPSRGQDKLTLTTDQFGKYKTDLAPGQYKICARKDGFEESCRCVRVEERQEAEVDFL